MDDLQTFIGLKPTNSYRTYETGIKQFHSWLKKPVAKTTIDDAIGYLTYLLRERKLSNATLSNRHGILAAYFDFLLQKKKVKQNVFHIARTLIPRRQKKQVRPTANLTPEQVRAVLDGPDPRTAKGLRDRAILAGLFGGALRRSEARKLQLQDIEVLPDGSLCLVLRGAKSGEDERQIIAGEFAERVSELVSQRKSEGATAKSPLFTMYFANSKRSDSPMADSTFYRVFKKWTRLYGIHAACHSARTTGATKLLSEGASPLDVAKFLRHASMRSVALYDKRNNHLAGALSAKLKY